MIHLQIMKHFESITRAPNEVPRHLVIGFIVFFSYHNRLSGFWFFYFLYNFFSTSHVYHATQVYC